MDSPLPKDGKVFRHILEPAGLFMWLGLFLFGFGLFSGAFALSNPELRFGVALVSLSLAWSRLSAARWNVFVAGQKSESHSGWFFRKLFWGMVSTWPILPDS